MNGIEIRKWLLDVGKSQTEIAAAAGVSLALVNKCLKGTRSSEKVTAALKKLGCPKELLSDSKRAA